MLSQNIQKLKLELAALCQEEKIDISKIKIVAASKTVPPEIIQDLTENGIDTAGENRVQEFKAKYNEVSGIKWHFIGHLQTNKVKDLIGRVELIHSLDRASLADEIQKQSKLRGVVTNALIEINMGREPNKKGVLVEELEKLYSIVINKPNINLKGFMSVMPQNADEELYKKLHEIYSDYKAQNANLDILSVGMSNDYKKAVKHGSNMIRIGSLIFGQRLKKETKE